MTSEPPSWTDGTGDLDQPDIRNLIQEFRRRQLDVFRDRQPDLDRTSRLRSNSPHQGVRSADTIVPDSPAAIK